MQLPGNKTHQKILRTLLELFRNDTNIEAFIVFGSLGRGDWDDYSDVDLDAVVKNDTRRVVQDEIAKMLVALADAGFSILSSFEEFPNEQVLILDTLDRISIRFHLLNDTHPAIVDSMRVLYGKLSRKDIQKASIKKEKIIDLNLLNNKFLELSIYVPISLRRNKLINALFFLNKMRQTLIQIYIHSHNLSREFDFEESADKTLLHDLYDTYGVCQKEQIYKAFIKLLDIYEKNIEEISVRKIQLSEKHRKILRKVGNY